MQRVGISKLREISARSRPLPLFPMISPWIQEIECCICGIVKIDGTVVHRGCMMVTCAGCVLTTIEIQGNLAKCGRCRGDILDPSDEIGRTTFCNLPPLYRYLFDNLQFECTHCQQKMNIDAALYHRNRCERTPTFRPPNHIHRWEDVQSAQRDTVSNPVSRDIPRGRERLLVLHYNGQQLDSKFFGVNKDVADIKQFVGSKTGEDAAEIRIFKFIHKELGVNDKVGDIAQPGATHLTCFKGFKELNSRTALISFNDMGPTAVVPGARGRAQP